MSARNQQWLKWFIGFILVAAAAYAGVSLPAIQTPADVAIGAQAYTNFTGLVVEVPTTFATATPGVVINSAGLGKILDIQDASTPVFSIVNGGAWSSTGAGTHSSGQTVNNWIVASAPTAIATATPAAVIDSLGVSVILEVRDAATPIAQFRNGGALDLIANPIIQDIGSENQGMLPSIASAAVLSTTTDGALFTIADGEIWFVHAVIVDVTTNFDCTGDNCTMIVGDGTDTDGFCVLADAELQAADTEQTGSPAGWQCLMAATMGVFLDGAVSSAPHIYAPSGAAETIDVDVGGTDPTAGAATVYVVYTRVQ